MININKYIYQNYYLLSLLLFINLNFNINRYIYQNYYLLRIKKILNKYIYIYIYISINLLYICI